MKRSIALAVLLLALLAAPVHAQTSTPTPLPTNLRNYLTACYMLEESSGTRYDAVGSNDLTDNNTVLRSMGKINQGAKFTAANSEYLSIADNLDYSSTSSWSFAVWIRPAAIGAYQGIASKWTSATDGEFYAQIQTNGSIAVCVTDNTTSKCGYPSGTLTANTWYLLIVVYDTANQRLTTSVNAGTENLKSLAYVLPDTTNAFWLGRFNTQYMDGTLDGFMFWKGRTLTQTEKVWLYNDGYGRSCTEVMGHGMTATQTATQTAAPTITATSLPVYATVMPSGARVEISRTFSYGDIALVTVVALAFVFYIITWLFRYLWTAGKRTT